MKNSGSAGREGAPSHRLFSGLADSPVAKSSVHNACRPTRNTTGVRTERNRGEALTPESQP